VSLDPRRRGPAGGVRPRRQHPDLRQLFSGGALSPGYTRIHATSTARPLTLAGSGDSSKSRDGSKGRGSEGPTHVSVQVNPALFAFGVWSLRAEIAFVPFLSILGEYSRINGFNVPKLGNRIHLDGNLIDVGLHLWPMGDGARGFYLGPRYSSGSGDDQEGLGQGKLSGWGVDAGYQWVSGLFSFNLGAGLGKARATITPSAGLRASPDAPESLKQDETSETFLRPYVTIGLGLAF